MRASQYIDHTEEKIEKSYNWGQYDKPILKGTYTNEKVSGEVKVYKLTQEEMKEYLKKFNK